MKELSYYQNKATNKHEWLLGKGFRWDISRVAYYHPSHRVILSDRFVEAADIEILARYTSPRRTTEEPLWGVVMGKCGISNDKQRAILTDFFGEEYAKGFGVP